ncbi:MAG TPA: hypothetical protein VHB54_14885, partial [Mucilaginibacter sp.]|nr:hypothetical protein [Mucilaginibacter sp.]
AYFGHLEKQDLQILKKISPDVSANGFLYFSSPPGIFAEVYYSNSVEYEIICTDVNRKEFSSGFIPITKGEGIKLNGKDTIILPHSGAIIGK